MSTKAPATSTSPSTSATDSPRSRTCVTPCSRGLALRAGRSRKVGTCLRKSAPKEAAPPLLLGAVGAHHHHDRGVRPRDRLGARVERVDGVDLEDLTDRLRRATEPGRVLDGGGRARLVGEVGHRPLAEAGAGEAVRDVGGEAPARGPAEGAAGPLAPVDPAAPGA